MLRKTLPCSSSAVMGVIIGLAMPTTSPGKPRSGCVHAQLCRSLSYLAANPGSSVPQAGAAIIKSYINSCVDRKLYDCTMALLDTDALATVEDKFMDFAQQCATAAADPAATSVAGGSTE